jgi:hypothetical protein
MTYSPVIPKVNSSPLTSASPIEVNFSQWANIFSANVGGVVYNHMPMNDFNQGKHGAVIMQRQPTSPPITQDLAVLVAINTTTAAGSQPQLFAKVPQFTGYTNFAEQLTYNQVNTTGPQYQSFLPGGYLVYFGSTTTTGTPISVAPTPTNIIIALATPVSTTSYDCSTQVFQPNMFQINSAAAPSGTTFLYFVIADN